MIFDIFDILDFIDIDQIVGIIFCFVVVAVILINSSRHNKNRPSRGMHPTTINKSSAPPRPAQAYRTKPTVSSDGHRIPHSKDITCEGQYGHDHGNMPPRYIVHEEPTMGYCNLNGKIVALRDCWKY
ncbi:MAG: hypothetical protein K5668_06335 [Lachnospiraceae bacterium]|nr:hypothetical protein [Lachnospiraceae bacterium]